MFFLFERDKGSTTGDTYKQQRTTAGTTVKLNMAIMKHMENTKALLQTTIAEMHIGSTIGVILII